MRTPRLDNSPPYYAKPVLLCQMTPDAATIRTTLADAAATLTGVSESPRLDAEVLLAWALGWPRGHLFAHLNETIAAESARRFATALTRRVRGEPVAYITGTKEFWSLALKVGPDTLVPRPETETLVERALECIPRDRPCRVLDLGTGSGAIAIAIASERRMSEIVATDSSAAALIIARENAERHALENIRFVEGNWLEPVRGQRFDVIVSNPPYVREGDTALQSLRFEPPVALTSGPDGLDAIRCIAHESAGVAETGAALLLEHGIGQALDVTGILQKSGWADIASFKDLSGQARVITARMHRPRARDPS